MSADATLALMPQVLIRIDAAGEWPVVVDDEQSLAGEDDARWRFVAEVETRMDGHAIAQA